MALTFLESATLMNNLDFINRVKVAALQYAQYIQLQSAIPNSKTSWAQRTIQQPDQTARVLTPGVVMNPNVQQAGEEVTDNNLSAAVQVVADLQM